MRSRSTILCSDESDKYLRGSKSSPKQCFITLEFMLSAFEKKVSLIRIITKTYWER